MVSEAVCELPLHWYRITAKIIASSAAFFHLKSGFTGVPQCGEAQSIALSKGRISTLMKGKKIVQLQAPETTRDPCASTRLRLNMKSIHYRLYFTGRHCPAQSNTVTHRCLRSITPLCLHPFFLFHFSPARLYFMSNFYISLVSRLLLFFLYFLLFRFL